MKITLIVLLFASIAAADLNVRDFGAKGDAATDETAAVPGRHTLSADELIRLRHRGVDEETIRKLRQ